MFTYIVSVKPKPDRQAAILVSSITIMMICYSLHAILNGSPFALKLTCVLVVTWLGPGWR